MVVFQDLIVFEIVIQRFLSQIRLIIFILIIFKEEIINYIIIIIINTISLIVHTQPLIIIFLFILMLRVVVVVVAEELLYLELSVDLLSIKDVKRSGFGGELVLADLIQYAA